MAQARSANECRLQAEELEALAKLIHYEPDRAAFKAQAQFWRDREQAALFLEKRRSGA